MPPTLRRRRGRCRRPETTRHDRTRRGEGAVVNVPRVRFGPRESRGWLLGMTTAQLGLSVVAVFTITRILDTSLPGWVRLAWVGVAAGCLTVAFLTIRGRTIVDYLPVVAN